MNLSGNFPALTTPFEADGSVSLSGMKHNIGLYNRTGLSGYVVHRLDGRIGPAFARRG